MCAIHSLSQVAHRYLCKRSSQVEHTALWIVRTALTIPSGAVAEQPLLNHAYANTPCLCCRQLQENPTSSPAAAVPPDTLRDLTELTQSLAPKFDRLLKLCDSVALNPALEPTVFGAFLQGCAEGWLHEGLQKLGSGI